MKTIKLFFITFGLSINCCWSQLTSPQVAYYQAPPSANAASLGKYGEIPIGLYTGIAQINIPLIALSSRKLDINLSLDYNTSGIRVDEISSRIGLGWSLNSGGVITRTVMGRPDEQTNGYYRIKNGIGIPTNLNPTEAGTDFLRKVNSGDYDTELDQFFFNFNGRAGKFLRFDSGYFTAPYSKLSIANIGTSIDSFLIIDENGINYLFDQIERTDNEYSNDVFLGNLPAISAWYLSKIFNPVSRDSILFEYDNVNYSNIGIGETETRKVLQALVADPEFPQLIEEKIHLDQYIYGKRLKRITGNNWNAEMKYSSRTDNDDSKIDTILISNNTNGLVKKYILNYSSFGDGRLKLDSLNENSSKNEKSLTYRFSYLNPNQVISYYSQDHWGYFNGANNNSLIPSYFSYGDIYTPGADREPNGNYASTYLLNKIQYPTGGTTEFQYEANTYSFVNSSQIIVQKEKKDTSLWINLIYSNKPDSASQLLSITESQYVHIDYSLSNCKNSTGTCSSYLNLPPDATLEITSTDGSQNYFYKYGVNVDAETIGNNYIYLSAGDYRVTVHVNMRYDKGSIEVRYNKFTDKIFKYKIGPGLRIKKVTQFDGVSHAEDIVKTYEYIDPENNDISSGAILGEPNYGYLYSQYRIGGMPGNQYCDSKITYWINTSFNKNFLGTTSGSYTGYDAIIEHISNADSNSRIVYYFTSPKLYWDFTSINPFTPNTNYDWRRGSY